MQELNSKLYPYVSAGANTHGAYYDQTFLSGFTIGATVGACVAAASWGISEAPFAAVGGGLIGGLLGLAFVGNSLTIYHENIKT